MTLARGTDLGKTIVTRNGRKKNRELLFLASAANTASLVPIRSAPQASW